MAQKSLNLFKLQHSSTRIVRFSRMTSFFVPSVSTHHVTSFETPSISPLFPRVIIWLNLFSKYLIPDIKETKTLLYKHRKTRTHVHGRDMLFEKQNSLDNVFNSNIHYLNSILFSKYTYIYQSVLNYGPTTYTHIH